MNMYENIFYVPKTNSYYDDYEWSMRYKLDSGDLVEMKLYQTLEFGNGIYNVLLYIGKRKKGFQYLQQTGKGGVEGLLVAKMMIEEAIKCLSENEKIIVFADDERRWKIYKKYLIPLGFVEKFKNKERYLLYTKQ